MEVFKDNKYNLIETDNIIVKNLINYTINTDKKLINNDSGSFFLIDNTNSNITINLPFLKKGIYFEFMFNNNSTNSITFKTSQIPLDNSKFIGSDWLYLKRSNINISYSFLYGSTLEFIVSEKGEYIKFFCDGTNYYIVGKNDTNNNINNILCYYPEVNNDYIVNINLTPDNKYSLNIINQQTNLPISTLYKGSTYKFKFNTTTTEYNTITQINNTILYNIYLYIDYYNTIVYNFDNPTSLVKYKYKYPVLNYKIIDSNFNIIDKTTNLLLFNTTYIFNLNNNSIIYPTHDYDIAINKSINNNFVLDSNTSIFNIIYNTNSNLLIYNENNTIIYDHLVDRQFLIVNRDIKYELKMDSSNLSYCIESFGSSIDTYENTKYIKFTNSVLNETDAKLINVSAIDTYNPNNCLYILKIKHSTTSNIIKIPILFVDQIILEPTSDSTIPILNKQSNTLPINNNIVTNTYQFTVTNDVTLGNFELKFLNTIQSNTAINENIFKLMKSNLQINLKKANINNYIFKLSDLNGNVYSLENSVDTIFNIYTFKPTYTNINIETINYYSLLNNIIGGSIVLSNFSINDTYSGKTTILDLTDALTLNIDNSKTGNFYNICITNDNSVDTSVYTLQKIKSSSNYSKYYFSKEGSTTTYSSIDLYTSNKYEIKVDNSISATEVVYSTNKVNDILQFSNIEDGIINYKQTNNYTFITKKLNNDNTVSYIFDIPEYNCPEKLYFYNKNIRNMGGFINIISSNTRLKTLTINSLYEIICEEKFYSNNLSYVYENPTHSLYLKNLQKGSIINLEIADNTIIIKNIKFYKTTDNIIEYPDKISLDNVLTTKLIKNATKYDITLYDINNNIINYGTDNFSFIKNQLYTIKQEDKSNYTLDNEFLNTDFYIKITKNANNKLIYSYYTDSLFSSLVSNLTLYRGISYKFYQYHRSNYNPGLDMDIRNVFKVTVANNSNGLLKFFINNMETYNPKIIKNETYYFDVSDVINYNFKLSLYEDGLLNNSIVEYINSDEITNLNNTISGTTIVSVIKLKVLNSNINTRLYYYSFNVRNIGSFIDIVVGSINYNLCINEFKQFNYTTYSINSFNTKLHEPVYNIELKNITTDVTETNIVFYKNNTLNSLNLKLNFDKSVYNKIYNTSLLDVSDNSNVKIYVKLVFSTGLYETLSYFEFYKDINFNTRLNLPLSLSQNKIYEFIQPNYLTDQFKFYIYLYKQSNDYLTNLDNSNYDTTLFTYIPNTGFNFTVGNFYSKHLYYSGVYYDNTTSYYTGVNESSLTSGDKLRQDFPIYIIPEKTIYMSDTLDTNNSIHLTDSTYIQNRLINITQNMLVNNNIFNNDISYLFIKNNYENTTKNIELSIILTENGDYNYIDSYNLNDLYIPTGSNSIDNNWSVKKNKLITVKTNLSYSIKLLNTNYTLCYYDNTSLKDIYYNDTSTILNFTENKYITYFIFNNSTSLYTNNMTDTTDILYINTFSFTGGENPSEYYTLDKVFSRTTYSYTLKLKNSVNTFLFNTNNVDSYNLITHTIYKTSGIENATTASILINTNTDEMIKISTVFKKNNEICIYEFFIIKEDTKYINLVDYGTLLIEPFNIDIETKTELYLSKPVEYNLNSIENTNTHNKDLINEFKLELVLIEEYKSNEEDEVYYESNKRFILNNDYYSNVKTSDTVLYNNNVVSSNIYISDFRTIAIDISHISLLNNKITFYSDERAINEVTNNIIYVGDSGVDNSKIILNINPSINASLFYFSNIIFESAFKHIFTITKTYMENRLTTTVEYGAVYRYKYNLNIVPFLENQTMFYAKLDNISLNLDKMYFILYNTENIFTGRLLSEKYTTNGFNKVLYFEFDKFRINNNDILYIDNTYTLKVFKYKPGKIITPNNLHFDKLYHKDNSDINIYDNNITYTNTTSDQYIMNNKTIDNTHYLLNTETNNEKLYISRNSNEIIKIDSNNIENKTYDYTNTQIEDSSTTLFNINSTVADSSSIIHYNRYNNTVQTLTPNTAISQKESTKYTQNYFNILYDLYTVGNIKLMDDSTKTFHSININIQGINEGLLVLKPFTSYTFEISTLLLWYNSNIYTPQNTVNGVNYGPIISIVDITDTNVLKTSTSGKLDVVLPYTSSLYNTFNKLYIKVEFTLTDNGGLEQGYYNIDKVLQQTGSNKFVAYYPIYVDTKSVINETVVYKNEVYYISNYINSLYMYKNYIHTFDISDTSLFNKDFYVNLNSSNTSLNKILTGKIGTPNSKLFITVQNFDTVQSNTTNTINVTDTEKFDTNIDTSNKMGICYLNKKYIGNDSSNDYTVDSIQKKYRINYIGVPGYDGKLLLNMNKILDFNINTNNISQNRLYNDSVINFNHYNIDNIYKENLYNIHNNSYIEILEPIKLKFQYIQHNILTGTTENIDFPNYSYSSNYFPGKTGSYIELTIPKDIDNDNVYNEDIVIKPVGFYSNNAIVNVNTLVKSSNIYQLQKENSTIFITIDNNVVIRLPRVINSLKYLFIVSDVINEATINILSDNDIYFNNIVNNENIIIKNNKELIIKNCKKGDSFDIISNELYYYIENINLSVLNINNSITINLKQKLIHYPIINSEELIVTPLNNKFNINNKNVVNLYKDKNYTFNKNDLNIDYFEVFGTNVFNNKIIVKDNMSFKNYYLLYYGLKLNTLVNNISFDSFVNNKPVIRYKVSIKDEDLYFNNSKIIPTIYTNYVNEFDTTDIIGFYILENYNLTTSNTEYITTNKNIHLNNKLTKTLVHINDIVLDNTVKSINNSKINTVNYIYYKPIIIDSSRNILSIKQFVSGSTTVFGSIINIEIPVEYYNTYYFKIQNNVLVTVVDGTIVTTSNIFTIINNILLNYNYSIELVDHSIVLKNTNSDPQYFEVINTGLSSMLNLSNTIYSENRVVIPNIRGTINVNDYYNYYGNKMYIYNTILNTTDSNSIISIDLQESKMINLPDIKEGLIYTVIINEATIDSNLYIQSNDLMYYCNSSNKYGNTLVCSPGAGERLISGSSLLIVSNKDKYFIKNVEGISNIEVYDINIYTKNNSFSNLNYTKTAIENIDKYISVFDIHIIGVTTTTNKDINEQKFLYVAKVLAKFLDFDESGNADDIHIINNLVKMNSCIVLYETTPPTNHLTAQHENTVYIKYDTINIGYDYNTVISASNIYDTTVESVLELIINGYINVYPHIFSHSYNSVLDIYKYIKNDSIDVSNISIDDKRVNKSSLNITNIMYIGSSIINNENTFGSDIVVRIDSLVTNYTTSHSITSGNVYIENIGKGYKNNDVIKIEVITDVYCIIVLKNIVNTTDTYNVINCFTEVNNIEFNNDSIILNELINNKDNSIYLEEGGAITEDNIDTVSNTGIVTTTKLYDNGSASLTDKTEVNTFVKYSLLNLLNYNNKRLHTASTTLITKTSLVTCTLMKKYNKKFIGLYLSTSLSKILNINSIVGVNNVYDLNKIGYRTSRNSSVNNITVSISETNAITFDKFKKLYENIIFNNTFRFNIEQSNQYSSINVLASCIDTVTLNKTSIVVKDNNTTTPIVDTSVFTSSNYDTKKIEIDVNIVAEDTINKTIYKFSGTRTNTQVSNIDILKLISKTTSNEIVETVDNIDDVNGTYSIKYKVPFTLVIEPSSVYASQLLTTTSATNELVETDFLSKIYNITSISTDTFNIEIKITAEDGTIGTYNITCNLEV